MGSTLVAVAACNDAEPNATVEPTVPSSAQVATPKPSVTTSPSLLPVAATDVDVVYASPAYPLPWDRGEYDPLWGDLDADAPIINRLLHAIERGTPVEVGDVNVDEKPIWTSYSSLVMNLRFRNEDASLRIKRLFAVVLLDALFQVAQPRVEASCERLRVGNPVLDVRKQTLAPGQDQCGESRDPDEQDGPNQSGTRWIVAPVSPIITIVSVSSYSIIMWVPLPTATDNTGECRCILEGKVVSLNL